MIAGPTNIKNVQLSLYTPQSHMLGDGIAPFILNFSIR